MPWKWQEWVWRTSHISQRVIFIIPCISRVLDIERSPSIPTGLGRLSRSQHLIPFSAIRGFQGIRRRTKLSGSGLHYCTGQPERATPLSLLKNPGRNWFSPSSGLQRTKGAQTPEWPRWRLLSYSEDCRGQVGSTVVQHWGCFLHFRWFLWPHTASEKGSVSSTSKFLWRGLSYHGFKVLT